MNKSIFVFRHAALYRQSVYEKVAQDFGATFYFAKNPMSNLKMMDYSKLNDFKLTMMDLKLPCGFYFLKGMNSISLDTYQHVVFAGDIRDISSWLLLIRCKLLKKKSYLWSHAWYGKENIYIRIIKKIYYSFADNILLYGNYARDLMIKEGFSSTKLHVIYNSLDYKSDILLRNNIQKTTIYKNIFKNEGPILLFIGRLTLVKKLEILLEAQKLLIDSGFICNVIFIGDGEEKDNLKNFIHKNDLISFVHFWGESYNNLELSELIYNADLCVSPGNVGLTAIHSLSFGTPVITHNNFTMQMPEFESIIKGVTGDFFEFNSSASLANVIKTWLTKYPRKTSQLIENCYSIIDQKYNPDFQINLLRKLFLQNEKK